MSRGTIESKKYITVPQTIKELLKDQHVALTTGGWTSLVTASYVTATAQWVSGDWEMYDYVLKTKELRESHIAEHAGDKNTYTSSYVTLC